MIGELGLNAIPSFDVDDPLMLAVVDPTLVGEPSDIDRVGQNLVADARG